MLFCFFILHLGIVWIGTWCVPLEVEMVYTCSIVMIGVGFGGGNTFIVLLNIDLPQTIIWNDIIQCRPLKLVLLVAGIIVDIVVVSNVLYQMVSVWFELTVCSAVNVCFHVWNYQSSLYVQCLMLLGFEYILKITYMNASFILEIKKRVCIHVHMRFHCC